MGIKLVLTRLIVSEDASLRLISDDTSKLTPFLGFDPDMTDDGMGLRIVGPGIFGEVRIGHLRNPDRRSPLNGVPLFSHLGATVSDTTEPLALLGRLNTLCPHRRSCPEHHA